MLGVCVLFVGLLILTQLSSVNHNSSPVETSVGRDCRVRGATFDNPFRFIGHDRHAPPNAWRDPLVESTKYLVTTVASIEQGGYCCKRIAAL